MAFRKKYKHILNYNPDVLVLQECENEERLLSALEHITYNEIIWYGNNNNKGVAVLSFNDYHIELNSDFNTEFEYIIPITLSSRIGKINLFAIWAMPHKTIRTRRYVGQIWAAINYYSTLLNDSSILIGDFNSNAIWDKEYKVGSHTQVVSYLKAKGIESLYHLKKDCSPGKEQDPTLYLLKQHTKPYHLDYCFATTSLISSETVINVGKHDNWIKLSDHMPVFVEGLQDSHMKE